MPRDIDLDALREPRTLDPEPGATSPEALGEHLAHMVWESFSDFLTDPAMRELLEGIGVELPGGVPDEHTAGELMIFQLWAHTRAAQLGFHSRLDEAQVRRILDVLHQAVFEDMVENGLPPVQLPVFEQRVGVRYAEYHAAAQISDEEVGRALLGHLAGHDEGGTAAARILTERAIEVANPLRDFLEDIKVTAGSGG